jgi:hypothetical protein
MTELQIAERKLKLTRASLRAAVADGDPKWAEHLKYECYDAWVAIEKLRQMDND